MIEGNGRATGQRYRELQGVSGHHEVTLLELVDRILNKGVVVSGDITLAVADVDLVYVGLRALLTSVETATRLQGETGLEQKHQDSGEPPE
jgi:gas vesicle structural protein